MAQSSLSQHGMTVRRYDRERFVTALFAPAERREDLFALYAWNIEIARIRETVSEKMLGQIRLQWWRDALATGWSGREVGQPEADDLVALAKRCDLPRALLDRLVDARDFDMKDQPFASRAELDAYVDASAGTLGELAALALGGGGEAGRLVGRAWGIVGLMRAHAWRSQSQKPLAILVEAGAPSVRNLAEQAADHLAAARAMRGGVSRSILPALLPAKLADGYLTELRRAGYDLGDRGWSRVRTRPLRLMLANSLGRF